MRLAELRDARIAIAGFGREGRAALEFLRAQWPDKPLTLICNPDETGGTGVLIDRHLSLYETLDQALDAQHLDVVIKSPGISPYAPAYLCAQNAGVRLTSGSAIWFAENPQAHTICVTGTKGKSTVAALIAHLLRKSGLTVALAGNIGLPLLECSAIARSEMRTPNWWVIELSSFQTRDFDGAPTVALINNLYEEHLDWHLTHENYAADKVAIAAHAAHVVVNGAEATLRDIATIGNTTTFNTVGSWHVHAAAIYRGEARILECEQIPLPGLHNAQNVCAALAAIEAAGIDARPLAAHVTSFAALPHRLQTLGCSIGIAYVNDSIATTPYAAIEALRSFYGRKVTILVGGFDRGLDWNPFLQFVVKYPPHAIVTMGANGPAIHAALAALSGASFLLAIAMTLQDAVARAQALAGPDGVILLSPGAPSFDQFHDYAERGSRFAQLAGFTAHENWHIEGLGIA